MQASPPPDFMVFTGNANPGLALEIAGHLGIGLGAAEVGRFSDGEVTVEIKQNVRARDVFVVQPTCSPTTPHNATQRGALSSVPFMRISLGVSTIAISVGTPADSLSRASSEGWKSTR